MSSANHRPLPTAAPASAASAAHPARPKRRRDRAAKRQALIEAALRLFAAKGYESTTTREIAASAGCAEGLIHRYFNGKAGLLPALVEERACSEVVDLTHRLQPAVDFETEFLQLVNWEVEHMWGNRDFLKVFIPRAMVDPTVAGVMHRAVISVRAKAVIERLKRYKSCLKLPLDQLEALAQSVCMLGLVFGFLRPQVLGQDRRLAKDTAVAVAKLMVSGVTCLADRSF